MYWVAVNFNPGGTVSFNDVSGEGYGAPGPTAPSACNANITAGNIMHLVPLYASTADFNNCAPPTGYLAFGYPNNCGTSMYQYGGGTNPNLSAYCSSIYIAPVGGCTPGNCTCFPAGVLILMANGIERPIESLRAGDWLMGADGQPVQIHQIDNPRLGGRRMMAMADSSLLWSEEHGLWTRDATNAEWWWSANPNQWRFEVTQGAIGGLFDNNSMRTGEGFVVAHLTGWKELDVVEIDGFGPETPLYLPVTNGVPIIANGYVVGAGVNEYGYPYKEFKWNPDNIKMQPEVFV